jgi:hypothetical protein
LLLHIIQKLIFYGFSQLAKGMVLAIFPFGGGVKFR